MCCKKLLHIVFDYNGIWMAMFAVIQFLDSLPPSDPDDIGRHVFNGVIFMLAFVGCSLWTRQIYQKITCPLGTLGYAIQLSEVKRAPWFKWYIKVLVGLVSVPVLGGIPIAILVGSPVNWSGALEILMIMSAVSPYYCKIGSAVPLTDNCYEIPLRAFNWHWTRTDNVLSILEDGLLQIQAAKTLRPDVSTEIAGKLLRDQLLFTNDEIELLVTCLDAAKIIEQYNKEQEENTLDNAVGKIERD
eukprot:TRINITY_DN116727_c0_g1_i1.p1 TRINITY_DN116727_c0_g1~~TRINITY_DN116727_c0_g1_i1.p1  ORF type:complete len:244 (-),score=38.74 TRINITY_DN116727_c0_g1_i1:82-813(-)